MKLRNGVLQCAKLCTPPAPAVKIASSTFPWMISDPTLLSDAEGTEDEVEDVVGGSGAGDFVEGAQGRVEIEEQHLVGDARAYGVGCGVEPSDRIVDKFLVANAGQEPGFLLQAGVSGHMLE